MVTGTAMAVHQTRVHREKNRAAQFQPQEPHVAVTAPANVVAPPTPISVVPPSAQVAASVPAIPSAPLASPIAAVPSTPPSHIANDRGTTLLNKRAKRSIAKSNRMSATIVIGQPSAKNGEGIKDPWAH
jgi:hypothetical protein